MGQSSYVLCLVSRFKHKHMQDIQSGSICLFFMYISEFDLDLLQDEK